MTRMYSFQILGNSLLPAPKLEAESNEDFWRRVLPAWEKETRHRHEPGTVTCTVSHVEKVPERNHHDPGLSLQPQDG